MKRLRRLFGKTKQQPARPSGQLVADYMIHELEQMLKWSDLMAVIDDDS